MPELPEVETIARDLRKEIVGETVLDFWSDWRKGVKMPIAKFSARMKNEKIIRVERIGKNILLRLSGDKTVVVHLRMTGVLLVKSRTKNSEKQIDLKNFPGHVHHIFYLKSGKKLEFSDSRKFGSLELVDGKNIFESKSLKKLGVDVLGKKFTSKIFGKILDGSKINIKQLLMNQEKIAGIGNIYANEILFASGISPHRKAETLTSKEREKMFRTIQKIIKKAVRMRGTSISDYRDASGRRGKFQNALSVYGKAGKKCVRCGTIVSRIRLGQRGTFFCAECQK